MAFVGIDLGTTTSEVAIYKNSGPQILRDKQGKEIIDSVVAVDNKNRLRTVGADAKSLHKRVPDHVVAQIKRKMGTSERVILGDQTYLPQEISAMILRYLKEAAEEHLGETVDRAVITVPANFPDTARQATKAAGELAGLTVERIINEPTAAALAYGYGEERADEIVMVYDLGGGTFDVSVIEYVGAALDVKASSGDPHLGGEDFDRALLKHVGEQFMARSGVGIDLVTENKDFLRLLEACEQAKKELSFNPLTTVHLPFFVVNDGKPVDLEVEVARAQLERLIGPMIDRTEKAIDKALKDAGLERSKVDSVLLVGGSTRIPYVRKLVERVMGKKPKMDIDPDRAVALGAAVQAAIIDGQSKKIIMDRAPLSLGTAVLGEQAGVPVTGLYSEIIEANTPFLKVCRKTYYTLVEDQEAIDFRVYQKSNLSNDPRAETDAEPNEPGGFIRLAQRQISVPPGPAGQPVNVSYVHNLNGIIEVSISFDTSERVENFEVSTLLSEAQMAASQARMAQLWKESAYYDQVRATLHAAELRLNDGLEASARNELSALVDALKSALAQDDEEQIRRLESLLTDLLFDLED